MMSTLRFVAPLVLVLALLTWGAALVVNATGRRWFERDVALGAEMALQGAREAIVTRWRQGDPEGVRRVLADLAKDERVMAARACAPDGSSLSATTNYPEELSCGRLAGGSPGVVRTKHGNVHVSVFPVADAAGVLGSVVLVRDLAFVERREEQIWIFTLLVSAALALAASGVTVAVARVTRRGWMAQARSVLQGAPRGREFQPLLEDVRELVDRLSIEREAAAWGPDRLKQTLGRHLHGERVVIVANREPYIHERSPNGGEPRVVHPASGLVTALEPVMRACSGVWVAHGSGSADRETADEHGRVRVPPGEESYVLRRVWLTPEEERGYYYGFANEGLWPLCHIAHTRPVFRREDWTQYRRVNALFAEAVAEEVDLPDPIILVQDYHLALAPRLIRARLPRATILTFWHIPWPNAERFGICPWQDFLLEGLLGSDIVGFHTQFHCNNFVDGVDRFMEARIDRERQAIVHRGHVTMIRPYPISIDWPNRWSVEAPAAAECRQSVFAELGLPPGALLGVGVDRLDYTKGIEERLLAVERMLERHPELRGRFTFVQLAAPSRSAIETYRTLAEAVERTAARIQRRFGTPEWRPVVLLRAHHEPPAVFRYYRAADLCYVSSLHDGMNLVAKEFVAARQDERGVLVLSRFTGASRELTEALIVNPYDIDEAAEALAAALSMAPEEQQARMRAMRALLAEFNVYRWAGRMLIDAARLRQRDRMNERLEQGRVGEA